MYLKKTPNPHGRIRLSIVDTYYDKTKKCSRQKTVESIGWLDELEKQYGDPIAHFTKRVTELNEEKQKKNSENFSLLHTSHQELAFPYIHQDEPDPTKTHCHA